MARKLRVPAYSNKSAEILSGIGDEVKEDFETFRRICERDGVYIVADAQVQRAEQREEEARAKAKKQRKNDKLTEVGL
jgi:hypothetical protein